MFLDKWIPNKFLVKQEVCAIEVLLKDDSTIFYYTWLKNKGKGLSVHETGIMNSFSDLPKQILKAKAPIVVIINGKGIIVKRVMELNDYDLATLINQNLPTINKDEFYIQLFRQDNNSAFLSLCRKEQVDNIIKDASNAKIEVADVLIGPPAVLGVKPLWNSLNKITFSTQEALLTNEAIEEFKLRNTEKDTFKIDEIQIDANYVLGFSGGFSYLIQNKLAEQEEATLSNLLTKHKESNKLRFYTIVCVAIAFVIAITNVLFYTTYFDKNNKLETELSVYQGKYDQINKLLNDYQSKKGLIENAGVLNKNNLSEYADRIGGTLPEEVILTTMYFNPKDENIESEDSLVKFNSKQLILKGNCNKSLVINEWVNVLKMQKFVRDVSLEKFNYNKDGIQPNFEIKVITN